MEASVFNKPEYLDLSLLVLKLSMTELEKCLFNASKLFHTAFNVFFARGNPSYGIYFSNFYQMLL